MHNSVLQWADPLLTYDVCNSSLVLEIGSQNVNGSLRPLVERHQPTWYVGTDIAPGAGVDLPCASLMLDGIFQFHIFDLIICTEVLEHDVTWWRTLNVIRNLLAFDGTALITTRSEGFPYHGFPDDFWRFPIDGFRRALYDLGLDATVTEDEPRSPGVLAHVHGRTNSYAEGPIRGLGAVVNSTYAVTRIDRPAGA